ncbi:MAG: RNA methyltransferase [Bacilli bacterium]|nr:RNA methyltransferase [Bacilli bacterium]MDD4406625.1 RNA methyltransferase [Bacilli bacterium]
MIESFHNPKVKLLIKLKDKKYIESNNLFIVEGQYLVHEALKNNYIKEIFLLDKEDNIYGDVTYVTIDILKKITNLTSPPKVIALCYILKEKEINGNVLMLDNIKDPGNLGTIIRSAVAFNYDTIIISKESVSLYNPKVIRATEGMLFNINIITNDLIPYINKLKKKDNYLIYGTDVKGGILPKSEPKIKHALIIGSEATGIDENLLKLCNKKLYINMNDKCESLNASISASILMYELNK